MRKKINHFIVNTKMIFTKEKNMKKTFYLFAICILASGCQYFQRDDYYDAREGTYPLPAEVGNLIPGQEIVFDDVNPTVYAIAASRTTNKMLDDTASLYENKNPAPKLYIAKLRKNNADLPDGFYYSRKVTDEIIEGSRTFTVVNNVQDADFYLVPEADALANPGAASPAVVYRLTLFDKNNTKIEDWTEILKQLKNDDQSWW